MKKIVLLLSLSVIISSCVTGIKGNGQVKRENRELTEFDKIDVSGAYNLFIKQGDQQSVTIEADANLMDFIRTTVDGKELNISSEKSIRGYEKLNVYITVTKIKGIEASGACDVKSDGVIKTKFLELDLSGATDMSLELDCEAIDADASGASDINLSGEAEVAEYDLSGACDVKAYGLKSKRVKADLSGASDARVFVTKKLQVKASGASSVRYKGNPEDVVSSTSGAASVTATN